MRWLMQLFGWRSQRDTAARADHTANVERRRQEQIELAARLRRMEHEVNLVLRRKANPLKEKLQ